MPGPHNTTGSEKDFANVLTLSSSFYDIKYDMMTQPRRPAVLLVIYTPYSDCACMLAFDLSSFVHNVCLLTGTSTRSCPQTDSCVGKDC
jgi:hypothetical protein